MACFRRMTLVALVMNLSCGYMVSAYNTHVLHTTIHQSFKRQPCRLSSSSSIYMTASTSWWEDVQMKDAELPTSVKSDFPILSTTIPSSSPSSDETATVHDDSKPLIYFDSAATSQKPTFVTDALTNYYHKSNSNVHRGAHFLSRDATTKYEEARDNLATFINANSRNEVVFTSGATEALNLVAATYGRANIQKNDEILITELEHHSNIIPWQILAEEKGAVLKYIPLDCNKGCLDMSTLQQLVTPQTKLVSLQHVSNVMGCINPIDQITPIVRSLGHPDAKIILDACQSVPHMAVDVQKLNVDFLVASGHKMCGPTGIGFLWGKEEILNSMPPYMGGGEMIDEVFMDKCTYAKAPARFEAGTPSIAQAVGLGAAVEYLNQICGSDGMARIESYEKEIAEYFMKRMREVEGVRVLGPVDSEARAAIVSFVCDKVHPSDLGTFLDMEGIAIRVGHHCCQPLHRAVGVSHSARASLYFYNTKEEVDIFIEKLKDTLTLLGGTEDNNEDFVPFF